MLLLKSVIASGDVGGRRGAGANGSNLRALFRSHTFNAFCWPLAHFYVIALLSFNVNPKSIVYCMDGYTSNLFSRHSDQLYELSTIYAEQLISGNALN